MILPLILRCNKGDDVGICNVELSELQVFRNGQGQLRKCQIAWSSPRYRVCMADAPMVEMHTRELSAILFARDNMPWGSYPAPERDKESEPSKRKHTTVDIDGVKPGD